MPEYEQDVVCAVCGKALPSEPGIDLCSLACYVKVHGAGVPDDLDALRSLAEATCASGSHDRMGDGDCCRHCGDPS